MYEIIIAIVQYSASASTVHKKFSFFFCFGRLTATFQRGTKQVRDVINFLILTYEEILIHCPTDHIYKYCIYCYILSQLVPCVRK